MTSVLLFISSIILGKIGDLYSTKYGYLAPILITLSSFWILEFTRIEDDVLAIPFIIGSLYFFIKRKEPLNLLAALFLTLIAGLIWKGAFLFLLSYSLSSVLFLVVSILVFVFVINKDFSSIIGTIWGNFGILENVPVLGFAQQFLLVIGLLGAKHILTLQIIFWALLALINAKFAVYFSIFLSLGFVMWADKNLSIPNHNYWVEQIKAAPRFLTIIFVTLMILITGYHLHNRNPHDNQLLAVRDAVKLADGNEIINDWSYGYYILYYKGKPKYYAGIPAEGAEQGKGINLTEVPKPNCKLIKDYNKGFNENLRIYYC